MFVCLAISSAVSGGVAAGATRTVCATGCAYADLQRAIDDAVFGDVILLRAGETYVGHFELPAKSGTGWIEIRSDAAASGLPAAGQRLVPSNRPGGVTPRTLLPRIVGRGGAYKSLALLRTKPGAHGYVFRFIEFDGAAHVGYETLIEIGEDTAVAAPYDIVLDRVYVHGHASKGQKRAITVNGARLSILNSYIADIKAVNADSQAIAGWNGAGPMTIENNYLEAAGENVLFGGAPPAVDGLVPSDIVVRRNHLVKPIAWRNDILAAPTGVTAAGRSGGSLPAGTHYFRVVAVMATGTRTADSKASAEVPATVGSGSAVALTWTAVSGADRYRIYRGTSAGAQTVYVETSPAATSFTYTGSGERSGRPPTSGTKWVVKNIFELKNAQRVTLDGNTLENIWSAGQYGYAVVLTPRNSSDRTPWARVRDVTMTNNIVRHAAGVLNVVGFDDTGVTLRTERITLRNNLFHDIDNGKYGGGAKAFLIGGGVADVVLDRNTIVHENSSVVYAYGQETMPGFVYTNNISLHHTYGIMGGGSSTGIPTLTKYFPGAVVRCNVLAGGTASRYPVPNAFPSVVEWHASFVDADDADFRLKPGSVVAAAGCGGVPPGADLAALEAALGGDTTSPGNTPPPPPAGNEAPVADAGGPYAAALGSNVLVDGAESRDADGTIVDYRWTWSDDVLVRAADVASASIRGTDWQRAASADAAGGYVLQNPDKGAAKRSTALASPSSYVELKVHVAAGVPYHLWMRMRATNDAYTNDSLFVQFSGALDAQGQPIGLIGTTSALAIVLEEGNGAGITSWGWNDDVYGASAGPIYFAAPGLQTVRIQQREDGVMWDQFVLSSVAYLTRAPGVTRGDDTILDEDFGASGGIAVTHRYARAGVFPVVLTVTDDKGARASAETSARITAAGSAAADAGGPYTGSRGAAVAFDGSGSSVPSGTTPLFRWSFGDEIALRAPAFSLIGGRWQTLEDPSAAGGLAVRNSNRGDAKRTSPLAAPASYVEASFQVAAGVPYRLWVRMRAEGDAYSNDSVFVQFSGSTTAAGEAAWRIGTQAALAVVLEEGHGAGVDGWGWNDAHYGSIAGPVYFNSDPVQRIRVQQREDGAIIDQIILSAEDYYDEAPGATMSDTTLVPEFQEDATGVRVQHTFLRAGLYPIRLTVRSGSSSSEDATTVEVK
jgi:hypothetical protein